MAAAAAAATTARPTSTASGPGPGPGTQQTAGRSSTPTPAPATIGLDKPTEPQPTPAPPTPDPVHATQKQSAAHTPGSTPPPGPIELTLREERLEVTNEWHVLGTARLRKYVVTEPVERRVQVVRERVRVERVPVGEAERATLTAQEIAEAVEEVTLREERPAVRKYLAPLERVRMVVERYTEEKVIREELRREQVEIHDSTNAASGTHDTHGGPAHPQMPPGAGGRHSG